jgi:hypothetical protein
MEDAMRPTPADIAIGKAELGDWIDPIDVPIHWTCEATSPWQSKRE